MNEDIYRIGLLFLLAASCLNLGVLLLYAHTIMPGLKKVDDATFVRSFQAIDRAIINPFFMLQFFVPLLLFGVLCFVANSNGYNETVYLLSGGAAYFVAVALTMAINVPLNDGIKSVNSNANDDVMSRARQAFNENRWAFANALRAIANTVAVALTAVALFLHA